MKTKGKKLLILFLIVSILVPGLATPKKANALFGALDVVTDPGNTITNIGGWIQEWGRWLLNQALDVLLATLKKRLLDRMVDQTVQWIQGGGSPRFVTDPGGYLQDAADAAVGDTIQQSGLSNLCSSSLRTQIRVDLEQTTFQNDVSCTLSEVIENVESFDEDFRNGTWIAYNEVLKPQNNRFGVTLLAKNEAAKQESSNEQQAQQEVESGDGFLSQKRCMQWQEKIGESSNSTDPQTIMEGDSGFDHIETPDGVRFTGKTNRPQGSNWYCVESETVTPGSTIGDSVSKSVGSDIDFLVNADDLSTYVTAIADALINRLTKEAVSGLAGVFQSSEGSDPRGSTTTDCSSLGGAAADACEEYQDELDDAQDQADDSIGALEDQADEVENSRRRSQILTYDKCEAWASENIPEFGQLREQAIQECKSNALNSGPYIETGTSHILSTNQTHEHSGAYALSVSKPKQILLNYEWTWDSCPEGAGQCPELTQVSGDLAAEDSNIPGPTYTPTETGMYKLKLTVRDTGGDKTEQILEEKTMIFNTGDPHDLEVGQSHTHSGAYVSDPSNSLVSYDWALESCPQQCPDVTKSGTFDDGGGGNIQGPTFTPQEGGNYIIRLNVRDTNGNVTSQTITDTATSTAEE